MYELTVKTQTGCSQRRVRWSRRCLHSMQDYTQRVCVSVLRTDLCSHKQRHTHTHQDSLHNKTTGVSAALTALLCKNVRNKREAHAWPLFYPTDVRPLFGEGAAVWVTTGCDVVTW